jgi:Ca2+-binding RTX toxin-like protein
VIRASELSEGAIALVGVGADPASEFSSVPARLLANVPDAVRMRIANTPEALSLAEWTPYAAESAWYLPTGQGPRTVYVEFMAGDGSVTALSIAVPAYDPSQPSNYHDVLPITTAVQHDGFGGPIWSHGFTANFDGWASENGGTGTAIEYQPASWSSTGGAGDDGGHIWIDDSRWAGRSLSGGEVVIAFEQKVEWINPYREVLDTAGLNATFQIAGENIDLGTGNAYFFVEDASGLWRSDEPLDLGSGSWTGNSVALDASIAGSWLGLSGQSPGGAPDFGGLHGWGVLFDGYSAGQEPQGILRLDDFQIVGAPSPLPDATNIDQLLTYTEDGGAVALQPISIAPSADGADITVLLRLSSPAAGMIEGAGLGVDGLYILTGSAADVNAALAALSFLPAADYDQPVRIDVTVRAGLTSSPSATGIIELAPTSVADDPAASNLDQNLLYARDQVMVGLEPIRISDPDPGAQIEVVLTVPDGSGRLFGRVEQIGGGYRVTGSVAEVNDALATLSFMPSIVAAGPIEIGVTVSDGTGSTPVVGTITLTSRENAAPGSIAVVDGTLSVAENSANDMVVATVAGIDGDGDTLRYVLLGDGGGRFRIDQQGRIIVADTYLLDHESGALTSIVVRAVDPFGAYRDETFDIAITDVVGEKIIGDLRNNSLRGGTGDDQLWGSVGSDRLIGGAGDDTYIVLAPHTEIVEEAGEGQDVIYSAVNYTLTAGASVEILATIDSAGTASIHLTGNELANTIYGNAGINVLNGGGGADILSGDTGADVFVFDTALGQAGDVDQILDFVSGEDRIRLDGHIFASLPAGTLDESAFHVGTAAAEAGHRIIYDPATGTLSFDADGAGGIDAIAFANIGVGTTVAAADFSVAQPLRAEDLSPGQFLVDGVPDYSARGFGDAAVQLYANIPNAVEMRFGNTPQELAAADWVSYATTQDWILRNGVGEQTVFAEFRLSDGTVRTTSALVPVPPEEPVADQLLPASDAIMAGGNDGTIWRQDFSDGSDRWKAYDYDGGLYGNGNVFYPASWSATGGADGGGYIYAEDSRWQIDPETPHSILALTTYPQWVDSSASFNLDLTDAVIEFYLRGDALDLQGAQAYFWITDGSGRWKSYVQPLAIGDGEWAFNSVSLNSLRLEDWVVSFQSGPDNVVDFSNVSSWGIGFVGFDQGKEPTGTIALDEFVISRSAGVAVENADQLLVYDDMLGAAIAPLLITGPSDDAHVTVTLTLDNPSLGTIQGAGAGVDGVYTVSGTVRDVNATLAALSFRPLSDGPLTATLSVQAATSEAEVISLPHHLTIIRQGEIIGTGGDDQLVGTVLDDVIRGGAGDDLMIGGPGNDNYVIDSAYDQIVELAGEGNDRIFASASYTLYPGQHVEILSTDNNNGTAPLTLGGNELDNVIYGNNGDNILYGNGGDDYMLGLGGDDFFFVTSARDIVGEAAGGGNDRVFASTSYTLYAGQHVETLSTDNSNGTAAINLGGNELDNVIYGNNGSNIIRGNGGRDFLFGLGGNDSFYVDSDDDYVGESAGGGNDRIFASASYTLYPGQHVEILSTDNNNGTAPLTLGGNELDNVIYGNNGDNVLYGNGGDDYMLGLGGDDFFFVTSAGDIVGEAAGGGNDRVFASTSYTLYAGQHVETLSTDNSNGTAAINLGGNELDNVIYGNNGSNIIRGNGGRDFLFGLGGNDSFYVDSDDDYVGESAGGGNDRIFASASYTLYPGQHVEILSTDNNNGTAPLTLGGNELDNVIYGNNGDNVLYGNGGDDYMLGLGGDDFFFVTSAGDIVGEAAGGGNDRVFASTSYTLYAGQHVETLSTGNSNGTAAINLGGNELDNVIYGNNGSNIIRGNGGNDHMLGLGGADQFWFTSAPGPANMGTVLDFTSGDDKLALFSDVFTGLAPGTLGASAFVTGTVAQDADDRILYDPASGALYYDSDGNGGVAATQFATLAGAPTLVAGDFILF